MKKKILVYLLACLASMTASAESVSVVISNPEEVANQSLVTTMQNNLAAVLNEINMAFSADREPNTATLPLGSDNFASRMIVTLWSTAKFYCPDDEIVDRCWPLAKGGYLMKQIPIYMTPEETGFGDEVYQAAIVEFDSKGTIVDFRFGVTGQLGEDMDQCGSVASAEQMEIMTSLIEQFRTAYCTKDLDFLEKIFSDDALIITGKVIQKKAADSNSSSASVVYNRQSKQQYLSNLKRTFLRNKYIDVEFTKIGSDKGCGWITQSTKNPNFYGVRLEQKWRSSTYSDEGYVFLLWDFRNPNEPVIQVRTWQPSMLTKDQPLREEDIFDISSVSDQIPL